MQPVQLSPQVWLAPPQLRMIAPPTQPGRGPGLLLPQHPAGTVFGDGSHPTTRLCAGAVDLLCRQKPGLRVLDVGTGTGVLARIARARGAGLVIGTDIDLAAVTAARENARLDSATPGEIWFVNTPPENLELEFDLVVANILEGPLREIAPGLAKSLAPQGLLLLSGFTPLQTAALRVSFAAQGLAFRSESQLDGWAMLSFQRY